MSIRRHRTQNEYESALRGLSAYLSKEAKPGIDDDARTEVLARLINSYETAPVALGQDRPFLRQVVGIIRAAETTFGASPSAVAWLMNGTLPPFENRTAFDLVYEGRADDVISYLDSIDFGFVG